MTTVLFTPIHVAAARKAPITLADARLELEAIRVAESTLEHWILCNKDIAHLTSATMLRLLDIRDTLAGHANRIDMHLQQKHVAHMVDDDVLYNSHHHHMTSPIILEEDERREEKDTERREERNAIRAVEIAIRCWILNNKDQLVKHNAVFRILDIRDAFISRGQKLEENNIK